METLCVGNKLYQLVYWSASGRKMESKKILSVNNNTYTVQKKTSLFPAWYIKKEEIGIEWFVTKQKALESAIKLHIRRFKTIDKEHQMLLEEIESLKKWKKRISK